MRFRDLFKSARDDVFLVWLALVAFLVGGCTARGDTVDVARATLALAKAQRQREAGTCLGDYPTAAAAAKRSGKPLVVWVGVSCSDHPRLRRDLADAVHCHVAAHDDDRTPRVFTEDAAGKAWFVRESDITDDTADRIKAKWSK